MHENRLKSMEIYGNPWITWKSMEIHGNPQDIMDIHGNPRKPNNKSFDFVIVG